MSFKLAVSKDFAAVVSADLPGDNGKSQKISFGVRFARLSASEVQDMFEQINAKGEDGKPTGKDQDLVEKVLTGFGPDLLDEDGSALDFTPDNVARVCDIHPIRPAIIESFFSAYFKAKAKN